MKAFGRVGFTIPNGSSNHNPVTVEKHGTRHDARLELPLAPTPLDRATHTIGKLHGWIIAEAFFDFGA